MLLLARRRLWPGVLVATFATNLVGNLVLGIGAATVVGGAVANTVEPLVGALVVLHFLDTRPKLDDRRHLVVILAGAGVVGPLLGAVVGLRASS